MLKLQVVWNYCQNTFEADNAGMTSIKAVYLDSTFKGRGAVGVSNNQVWSGLSGALRWRCNLHLVKLQFAKLKCLPNSWALFRVSREFPGFSTGMRALFSMSFDRFPVAATVFNMSTVLFPTTGLHSDQSFPSFRLFTASCISHHTM